MTDKKRKQPKKKQAQPAVKNTVSKSQIVNVIINKTKRQSKPKATGSTLPRSAAFFIQQPSQQPQNYFSGLDEKITGVLRSELKGLGIGQTQPARSITQMSATQTAAPQPAPQPAAPQPAPEQKRTVERLPDAINITQEPGDRGKPISAKDRALFEEFQIQASRGKEAQDAIYRRQIESTSSFQSVFTELIREWRAKMAVRIRRLM